MPEWRSPNECRGVPPDGRAPGGDPEDVIPEPSSHAPALYLTLMVPPHRRGLKSISCSIRAKSASPGFSFSLQISARKARQSRS